MPVKVKPVLGRSGSTGGRSRTYTAFNAPNEAAAMTAVLNYLVEELGPTLLLDGFSLKGFDYAESTAQDAYEITCSWGNEQKDDPPETNTFSITFDFAANAQRVVAPINEIRVYGPDPKPTIKLIGDTGVPDEAPEGVDIYEPTLTFSETHYKPADFVDNDYLRLMRRLIGRTNNAVWRGFAVGELIAMGVSGSRRSVRDDWELQYKFSAGENQTDLTIAGITGITKGAWEFLWPRRSTLKDGETLTQGVGHICVTNPFGSATFASFGID